MAFEGTVHGETCEPTKEKNVMMPRTRTRLACYVLVCSAAQTLPLLAQEPILPHGDPRKQSSEEEKAKREDIRDQRLKQQGQGSNYRVEGEPQPSANAGSSESTSSTRQDTDISDPSVNPGQAAGMKTVQGRVVDSTSDRLVLHQPNGADTTLLVDGETKGDTDLHPGDLVTGLVTPQGRAVTIQKQPSSSKIR
jgi:hypothetical protein